MQNGTQELIAPQTREQMIAAACGIEPRNAYQIKFSEDAGFAAATPIYTEFVDKSGEIIQLRFESDGNDRTPNIRGRYGAGYIRVSTIRQRRDGWSIQDQATRIIDYFVERRMAFCIFSDSSLSGKMPMESKALIAKMHKANAERYERSYRAVFLTPPQQRELGPERVVQMETWLSKQVAIIANGGKGEGLMTDLDEEDGENPSEQRPNRGRKRKNDAYRPGLSEMLRAVERGHISTLAITDVSRLARSQSLQVIITDILNERKVDVVGLIETTDYINDRTNLSSLITATVLSLIAEHKLREVSIGAFRGIAEMLKEGKPHGSLPYWCNKDANGDVLLDESAAATLRQAVRLYLNDENDHEDYGLQKLANHLNNHLEEFPASPTHGKRKRLGYWASGTLKSMFRNPALCGEQHSFGQEWKVLPEVINKPTWLRLQSRMNKRSSIHTHTSETDHILAYMMRCQCGSTVAWNPHTNGSSYYTCDAFRRSKAIRSAGPHIKMDAPAIEDFISRLAREYPQSLMSAHRDLPERKAISLDIANLRRQAIELEEQIPVFVDAAREKARADLITMKRPASASSVEAMAQDDETVVAAMTRLADIKREIEQREHLLQAIMPSDHIEETQARLERWDRLTNGQKNEILRRLIFQIRGERDEAGTRLFIVMNNIQRTELPVITMVMTPFARGFIVKPPAIVDWLTTW